MREQFSLCVYLSFSITWKLAFLRGEIKLPQAVLLWTIFSQEPWMPFPINPLALVDKPSVLGALWGNPSVRTSKG